MYAILKLVGLPVAMISSSMDSQVRAATMDQWNAQDSALRVLVLNTNVSSAGLNCHINCSVGIITSFIWNVATFLQALGRLFRLGQKEAVKWFLLRVAGTINDWNEERMLRKVCPSRHWDQLDQQANITSQPSLSRSLSSR